MYRRLPTCDHAREQDAHIAPRSVSSGHDPPTKRPNLLRNRPVDGWGMPAPDPTKRLQPHRKPDNAWLPGMLSGMAEHHWIVKSEPASYGWKQFVADGHAAWTGVRNYQARNNLRLMKIGDPILFYHSVTDKAVVGIAEVIREAYSDPTAKEGDWSCVDLVPQKQMKTPVPLEVLRSDPATAAMALVRNSRISVTPVTLAEYRRIVQLGGGLTR